jgi:FixJ family two-component response regulator
MNNTVSFEKTVFVVDDDEAMRDSLRWLLEAHHYRVECFAGAESFLVAYQTGQYETQVCCVVLDVRMPGMTGLELQEKLLIENDALPVIFITGHGDVPMAVSAIRKGAHDFIEKPFEEIELRSKIEQMFDYACSRYAERCQQQSAAERLNKLTARERQVFDGIIAGCINKQIAQDLGISPKTVEAHRANLMTKLEVKTMADLMKLALLKKTESPS